MAIPKIDLEKYYSSGKSMFQISKICNCSPNTVVYWMKKYGIKRRSMSEAIYIFSNPDGDPFNLKSINNLSKKNMYLYGLGIGLYWGEGEKTGRHAIRVSNTDPLLILKFREFLLKICKLKVEKIGYGLVCFNDINPNTARKYWSKILKISPIKFGKITEIPSRGKGTYKKKSKYGVCTIYASNIKLKKWIMAEIEKLKIA